MPDARRVRGGLGALLAVMCAALALVIGAGSSLALAAPELARVTGATQTELTWAINVYALTFAALLLPLGIAADRFGRRGALLLGLAVFAACSAASGLVEDPVALIVLRGAAGIGAAAVMPATLSVLVDAHPPQRRASAIGVWAAVSGAGALLGLLLAGVLLEFAWWGSVQVAFGALSAVVLLLCAVVVPPSRNPDLPLDPVGGLLSLAGLGGVVFGVVEGPERGWTDSTTLTALAAGGVCLAAFVGHELRSRHPMLDVRLFRDRGLSAGSTAVFLQFFAAFGLFFLAPQWLQYVHGLSPLQAALWLAPMALGIGPTAQLAPALLRRLGARTVAAWGLGQMGAGLVLLARQSDGDAPLWHFGVALFVFGVGFGLALTPGTTLIIDGLPADRRTLAAAVNDVTREVGGALGGAVAATVLLAVYRDDLVPVVADLPSTARDVAGSGLAQAVAVAERAGPAGAAVADGARDAFGAGYAVALLVGAAVLLAGAVLCGLVAPRRGAALHRGEDHASRPVLTVAPRRRPVVSLARESAAVPARHLPRSLEAVLAAGMVLGVFGGVVLLTHSLSLASGGWVVPAAHSEVTRTAPPERVTPAAPPVAVPPSTATTPPGSEPPPPAPAQEPAATTAAPPPPTTAAPPPTTPPATTTPPAETTTPPAETTTPPAETTTPPVETTTPPAETTTPPAETTTPPAETTIPPAETTTPPAETTTPPAETSEPPAEATTPPAGPTTETPAPEPPAPEPPAPESP
ncbi:EmrB/QacA subfamily drug resistance transporter [Geodermatophilus normandii]|uniref:EmrB/QacA subfamily drug resistance transporter n=1 Tax=Geodermatophilus normandii TaxID=1137989 RepID=A0A317QM48_9ACTN|nr:MFS transporter [Geodermatophilus normandii]PWW24063.1 EmrB/QacA subfamily drug resistance transporter [Geodermatophilus normandii]